MDIYELLRAEAKAKKAGEPVKEQYGRISIDLSTARTDEEMHISGNQITIAGCDGGATTTYFKLNSKHSRKIYPAEITKMLGNFGGVYMSNAAEPGKTLTIYLGRDIFIFPARAEAVRVLKEDGTTIDPGQDKRHIAHTGAHLKATLTNLDGAQQLSATSIKVKWAIIASKDYAFRWGFSSTIKQSTAIGQYVGSGGSVAVECCDLSEIYFIDGDGVNKPVLQVEYIEEAV
jgi:hypothetical protein